MYSRLKAFAFLLALALLAPLSACNRGPAGAKQPSINPSSAGRMAMEEYDKNGDGKVDGDELEAAPALKEALAQLDTNGDKAVSADEVAARVNRWKEMQTAMTSGRCRVTLDGEPLAGAKIVFEPEAFLGDDIKASVGETNVYGEASPMVPPELRGGPNLPGGVQLGLYKVRISKIVNGKETIPARYNTQTIIGQEISYDDPAIRNRNLFFTLKSGK